MIDKKRLSALTDNELILSLFNVDKDVIFYLF